MTNSEKDDRERALGADWTTAEKEALAELARGVAPPPELEEAVVTALRARGLLGVQPRRRSVSPAVRASWGLLAATGLVALGFALGRTGGREATPDARERAAAGGRRYVLLLLSDASEPPATEEARRVAEYKEWARGLAVQGHLAGGEKLAPEETVLGAEGSARATPPAPESRLGGFFMITARDHAEAVAIARGCPHLRYGGRIILRRIEEV